MFKTLILFILDYVNLVPFISIHTILEESQYVVDVMRCMHKKRITDDILTLLQLFAWGILIMVLLADTSRNLVTQSTTHESTTSKIN